jgi:hypothetical protein
MAAGHELSPTYSTGGDYTVETAGVRFAFSARDFAERVGQAALRLGLIDRDGLGAGELDDLVALAAHGRVDRPASPLAGHLDRHRDVLLGGGEDLVHWLRRLVFRGAWIDTQIAQGRIQPVFDEARGGFRYRRAATGVAIATDPPLPDWSIAAYGSRAG